MKTAESFPGIAENAVWKYGYEENIQAYAPSNTCCCCFCFDEDDKSTFPLSTWQDEFKIWTNLTSLALPWCLPFLAWSSIVQPNIKWHYLTMINNNVLEVNVYHSGWIKKNCTMSILNKLVSYRFLAYWKVAIHMGFPNYPKTYNTLDYSVFWAHFGC